MKSNKTNVAIGEYTILYHSNDNYEILLMIIYGYKIMYLHTSRQRGIIIIIKKYTKTYIIRPKNKIIDFLCV